MRKLPLFRSLGLAGLGVVVAACGSAPVVQQCTTHSDCSADSVCSQGFCQLNANGTLQIIVSGLPGGNEASVVVKGPAGFTRTVTGNQMLVDVPAGTYSVVANDVNVGDYSFGGTVSSPTVTVTALGATSATAVAYTVRTGALKVAIAGVPPDGEVVVTGPGDFRKVIRSSPSQILPRLLPGTYAIAPTARLPGPIVDTLYDGAGALATVAAGGTSSTGTAYAARIGTGKLWMEVGGGEFSGYGSELLAAGGTSPPTVSLAILGSGPIAFDSQGNMWVSDFFGMLRQFPPDQLAASGTPTARVLIASNGTSLNGAIGMAFDSQQNLWVSNLNGNTLERFTQDQLAASGNPTPSVTVTSLVQPIALAFDSEQNLWVAAQRTSTIVKFTPEQLSISGAPTPAVTISGISASHLAFDETGDLWVASGNGSVLKFTAAQLASSGSPAPDIILAGPSLQVPTSIAFDNSGNLWVSSSVSLTLIEFAASQLLASGTPVPVVTMTIVGVSGDGLADLVFNPPPLDSTLFH